MNFHDWWQTLPTEEQMGTPRYEFGQVAFEAGLKQALLSFPQLSDKQRQFAVKWHYETMLKAATEGTITFTDPAIVAGVDRANETCERLQTPWFFAGYVHDEVGDLIMQVARSEAESAHYLNPLLECDVANCVVPQD